MTFRVGQKVVCIDGEPFGNSRWWYAEGEVPVEGSIYTIARMHVDQAGYLIFGLLEIRRCEAARNRWGNDVGYGAFRFRPADETDISIFTKILDDVNHKVPVLAAQEETP